MPRLAISCWSEAGKAAPETSAFLIELASRPALAAASRRIFRKSGVRV